MAKVNEFCGIKKAELTKAVRKTMAIFFPKKIETEDPREVLDFMATSLREMGSDDGTLEMDIDIDEEICTLMWFRSDSEDMGFDDWLEDGVLASGTMPRRWKFKLPESYKDSAAYSNIKIYGETLLKVDLQKSTQLEVDMAIDLDLE